MVEGGHHPRNRPPTLGTMSVEFYHYPVTVWAYSTPQPNTEVPAPTGGYTVCCFICFRQTIYFNQNIKQQLAIPFIIVAKVAVVILCKFPMRDDVTLYCCLLLAGGIHKVILEPVHAHLTLIKPTSRDSYMGTLSNMQFWWGNAFSPGDNISTHCGLVMPYDSRDPGLQKIIFCLRTKF